MIGYKEKGCNDDCRKCPHNIPLKGRKFCDLKMVDLTGIKIKFKKGRIIQGYY